VIPAEAGETRPQDAAGPVLEIDLDAVAANWRLARDRHSGPVLSAVVKSDAYGLGLEPLARALAAAGCAMFWVNDLDEALRLRAAVPGAEVLTLFGLGGADPGDFAAAGVCPVLTGPPELGLAADWARRSGTALAAAVQVDTGLGRFGLTGADVARLRADPGALAGIGLRLWMTHLAAFDRPDAPANAAARAAFLAAASLRPAARSLAASSGLWMDASWHMEVARAGSALYGVRTLPDGQQPGLRRTWRLTAPILHVADHPAGRTVGYGGQTRLDRPSRIATLRLGYADGVPQALGGIGGAVATGTAARFVGGLAMNLAMLDVTGLDPAVWRPGRRVTVLGPDDPGLPSVEAAARHAGCAPNVLVTQIAAACARRWTGGAAVTRPASPPPHPLRDGSRTAWRNR
jgi:alanine racemase